MLDFEGKTSEPSRTSSYQVVLKDGDDEMIDLASGMASVSASDWEANIDNDVSTAFSVPPSVEQHSRPGSNVAFYKAMNMRGDISNFSASVGSFNFSSEPCSLFYIDKPSFSRWKEVECMLKSVINPKELEHVEAKALPAQASRSRGVSKEFLSKLWLVPENLAEKSIENNAQLRRQSKDNALSRNHTTNDCILRCKRLESVFFNDTMFVTNHKSTRGNKCCQFMQWSINMNSRLLCTGFAKKLVCQLILL